MYIYKYGLFEDIADNIYQNRLVNSYGDLYKRYISEDKNISAMEYYVEKGFVSDEHFHDWLEVTLVVKGEQHVFVKGKEHILTDGDILFIHYNDLHHSYMTKETYKLTIQFKMGYIEKMIPEFDASVIDCSSMNILNNYDRLSYSNLVQIFCFLFRAFSKNAPKLKADFYGYCYLFFYYLMKECTVEKSNDVTIAQDTYVKQILSYLNRHYNENVTLQTLSKILHLTPQYISKIIKEETGKGFKEYLIRLRLEQALFLMKNTDKNLLNISEECGFSNNQSFIYYFKNEYGISPSQYRKSLK